MARTLADMTLEEQKECEGMWCDCNLGDITVRLIFQGHAPSGHPILMDTEGYKFSTPATRVTPRFDHLRAWNPDGTQVKLEVEVSKALIAEKRAHQKLRADIEELRGLPPMITERMYDGYLSSSVRDYPAELTRILEDDNG